MIRRPPRSTQSRSSAASDVYKRRPWDACGLGWYAPSEPGNAVRNPGSSKGSGNEPCRCAKPTAINGMRGFFPTSAACVKCPLPQDRSPSLDLRFRVKRLAGQPAPRRRAQTLKSPPNRAFYRFSLRAGFYPEPVTTALRQRTVPLIWWRYSVAAGTAGVVVAFCGRLAATFFTAFLAAFTGAFLATAFLAAGGC